MVVHQFFFYLHFSYMTSPHWNVCHVAVWQLKQCERYRTSCHKQVRARLESQGLTVTEYLPLCLCPTLWERWKVDPTYQEFFSREKQLVWTWRGLVYLLKLLFETRTERCGEMCCPPDGQLRGGKEEVGEGSDTGRNVRDGRRCKTVVIRQTDK